MALKDLMGKFRELSSGSAEKKLEVVTAPKWLEKKRQEKQAESKPQEIKVPGKPKEKKAEKKPEKQAVPSAPLALEEPEEPSVNPLLKAYYFLEDGYYSILDKIDSVVPVYKIIDPVDRIFPSFILFIAFIVILILIAFSWSSIFPSATFTVTLSVLRADTNAVLPNQEILVGLNYIENGALQLKQADAEGKLILPEVKKDALLRLDINAHGFGPFSDSWTIDSDKFLEARLEPLGPSTSRLQKTIKFTKSTGELILDDTLQVTFSCKDDVGQVKILGKNYSSDYLSNGSVTVSYTEDCELYVSVTSLKYSDFYGAAGTTITLQEKNSQEVNGSAVVTVKDSADSSPLEGMKVLLFPENDDSSSYTDSTTNSSGKASFSDLAPDSYYARAQDPDAVNPKYSCTKSTAKNVVAGSTTEFSISCTKISGPINKNSVRVTVADKQKNSLKAKISLYDSVDKSLFSSQEDVDTAVFLLEKDTPYILVVSKEGFFPYENANVKKGDSINVTLKAASDLNAGTAKIFVDRFRNSIPERAYDAWAELYYAEGDLADIPAPYNKANVGTLGYAIIKQVKLGNYYAKAFTRTEEGYSDVQPIDANLITEFYVPIYPKRGLVKFTVVDLISKKKITDFKINFFKDIEGKEKLPENDYFMVPGPDGNSTYSFPLGESFYAVISKEGYNTTLTPLIIVYSSMQVVDVPLTKSISAGGPPKIEFIKIFDPSDPLQQQIEKLELGKVYSAQFVLSADKESFYAQVHLRAGSSPSLLEKDPLSILPNIEPSFLAEERRGKSFGFNDDLASKNLLSPEQKAKWVELGYEPSNYSLASSLIMNALVKVSDSVAGIDGFKLSFRALSYKGDKDNPEIMRDPADTRLFSSALDFFKAKTKDVSLDSYFCNASSPYCFSDSVKSSSLGPNCAVRFFGSSQKEGIDADVSSYGIMLSSNSKCEYNYSFALINNSDKIDSSSLEVKNSTIEFNQKNFLSFKNYSFTSKTQAMNGVPPSNSPYALPSYEKSFSAGEAINLSSVFYPTAFSDSSNSGIGVLLYDSSDRSEPLFKGFTELVVLSDGDMIISLSPEPLLPFIDSQEVTITVTDSSTNQPLQNVSVDVFRNEENSGSQINGSPLSTDSEGKTSIILPALAIRDKIIINASFSDSQRSYTQKRTIEVQSIGLYSITDESGASINSSNPLNFDVLAFDSGPYTKKLNLSNLAVNSDGLPLIEESLLDSNFNLADSSNYLNKKRMDDALYSYYNKTIKTEKDGGTVIDVNVFVDTSNTQNLLSDYFIDANILMNIKVGSQVFPGAVPMRVHIYLNKPSCVQAKTSGGQEINRLDPLSVSVYSIEGSKGRSFILYNVSGSQISVNSVNLNLSSKYIDFASTESQLKERIEGTAITAQGIASDFNVVLSDEVSNLLNPVVVTGSIDLSLESSVCSSYSVPFRVMIIPSLFASDSCPTGAKAAPKILLNWSWDKFNLDNSNYSGKSLCDKGNKVSSDTNYIYCDAAQFSMALAEKIAKFNKTGSFSFQSYLMADAFTDDFIDDFKYETSNINFLPPSEVMSNSLKYFSSTRMNFNPRTILKPGLYDVRVSVDASIVNIELDLNKSAEEIEGDSNLSVFYFIPFDGEIGLKDGELHRDGYGAGFSGDSAEKIPVASYNDTSINSYAFDSSVNPLRNLNSTLNSSADKLNDSESRGILLDLKKISDYFIDLDFLPSYATPLLLETKLNSLPSDASIYYSLINPTTSSKIDVSLEPFLEWMPADRKHCVDFRDERPYSYLDSKANSSDSSNILGGINNVFRLSWQNPIKKGILSIYSAVFTPTQSTNNFSLKTQNKSLGSFEYIKLSSADNDSLYNNVNYNQIPLNGIKGSQFNDSLKQNNYIKSISNALEMLKSGDACIENYSNHTVLKWNSNKLYRAIEKKLVESISECIAFTDTESPTLSLTSQSGTISSNPFTIKGTATDNDLIELLSLEWIKPDGSTVLLDITSTLDSAGNFSKDINLLSGINSLLVCAEDPSNNKECADAIEVTYAPPAVCGNGTIEGTEQCDGINLNDQSCQSLGFDSGTLYCSSDCTFDTSNCLSAACDNACGSGIQALGCYTSGICEGKPGAYTSSTVCNTVGNTNYYCCCPLTSCDHDGVKDAGEQCDVKDNIKDFGGKTCSSFGFNSGRLMCVNCTIDTELCTYSNCNGECEFFSDVEEGLCPSDCPGAYCGNTKCEKSYGENNTNCPEDCKPSPCDGICYYDKDFLQGNCRADCPSCDGVCQPYDTYKGNCNFDCPKENP
ncbi:MAG: hypothetical protein AB1467_04355 [Candidatus Diapherotrites archaeon]